MSSEGQRLSGLVLLLALGCSGSSSDKDGETTGVEDEGAGGSQGGGSEGDSDDDDDGDDTSGGGLDTALDDGLALYTFYCDGCHAIDGTGTSFGPDITVRITEYADEALIDFMQTGQGAMPPIKVSDEEGAMIVEHMRATFVVTEARGRPTP